MAVALHHETNSIISRSGHDVAGLQQEQEYEYTESYK